MIRQTHTYLVSAMSGATLIVIAIAFFVVLVSAQVFHDWPISGLGGGGGGGEETVAVAKAAPAGAPGAAATSSGAKPGGVGSAGAAGRAAKPAAGSHLTSDSVSSQGSLGSGGGQLTIEQGGSGGGSAGNGSGSATPASSPSSSSAGNGNSGSSSASGGSGDRSGGAGGGSASGSAGTTPSPSGQVTETANNTVSKVDETALGGTLHETGVTEVTESVVKGVAGPESPVGHVVDETVGAVGGLLHGNR
jgi:hypothetical protein